MKKFIIGLIVGIGIATAMTSYADDIKSLIGAKVQTEYLVSVDGKLLDNKAVVINGISYAPLRTVGDVLGLEVKFDKIEGIELNQKGVSTVTNNVYVTKKERIIPLQAKIDMLDRQIKDANRLINGYESTVSNGNELLKQIDISADQILRVQEGIKIQTAKLEEYRAILVDLEKQKEALMTK